MESFLMNETLWIGIAIFFAIFSIGLGIFYYFLFKKTHIKTELKSLFNNSPMGIFFQDNRFAEWKPVTPINGIVYDKHYGPFIASSTYVDKKTKKVIIPLDVDLDGKRDINMKEFVEKFKNVTNNQENIITLRTAISDGSIEKDSDIEKLTSENKFTNIKNLFMSSAPHNIKSKIEKIVSERIKSVGAVNPMTAIIIFGAVFGILVLAALILRSTGGTI